jgi:hypothetical protein
LVRILEELQKNLPSDVSAIWLLEDIDSDSGIGLFTSPLRLASIYTTGEKAEYTEKITISILNEDYVLIKNT